MPIYKKIFNMRKKNMKKKQDFYQRSNVYSRYYFSRGSIRLCPAVM